MSSRAIFELYRDRKDEWRWQLRHDDGTLVADWGEEDASKQKARQGIESVKANVLKAPVETAD